MSDMIYGALEVLGGAALFIVIDFIVVKIRS